MTPKTILIPGGAGFVGSNLAELLKGHFESTRVIAFDNLKRRGSELSLARLAKVGVEFVHGDIRSRDDFDALPSFDLLLDCSAEPSVNAGRDGAPDYLLQTNLVGTLNLLELARRNEAAFMFLSTSRVYPLTTLNELSYREAETRLEWTGDEEIAGMSARGVAENFPLDGPRSFYGSSKLAGELILQEYFHTYSMPAIINRCGVIAGPWQMGKVDQGVITLWVARHIFGGSLSYTGYGGLGKQVRDVLHVRDLFALLIRQLGDLDAWNGTPFNVGGGVEISTSLLELTAHCEEVTQVKLDIGSNPETSPVDIPIYLTDNSRVRGTFDWKAEIVIEGVVSDIHRWIIDHREMLAPLF